MQTGVEHPPVLSASSIDREKKAQQHELTMEMMMKGVQIVDPAQVNKQPVQGQGRLHYQVDSGPVIDCLDRPHAELPRA